MPNPGVVLERVGSTAERLRQLPYEKRVCKTEAYPAVSRPDKEYTGLSVAEFAEWAADVGLEATVLKGGIDRGTPRYRPYLTSLHLKDTRTIDGPSCRFEWCELGTGDPDYAALFRAFVRDRLDVVIAVASHYEPPGGTPADGVRLNHRTALELAESAQ